MSSSLTVTSPLSAVPVSVELPADYYVRETSTGCEVHLDGYGLVGDGFDSYFDAVWFAQDHAASLKDEQDAADAAEAEYCAAAYQDELDKIYSLVNAQGGYVEPNDIAGQARVRAINDVLAFIEKRPA